jgi:hypothetical protein
MLVFINYRGLRRKPDETAPADFLFFWRNRTSTSYSDI